MHTVISTIKEGGGEVLIPSFTDLSFGCKYAQKPTNIKI